MPNSIRVDVFQEIQPSFGLGPLRALQKVACFTAAAGTSSQAARNAAWKATNSFEENWTSKPTPGLSPEPGIFRSTSTGDVMVVYEPGQQAKAWRIVSIGEEEIPLEKIEAALKAGRNQNTCP